jgi:3-phenylpropionate/trans-cinnamate dioxygenase ferredoxin reductase subunit
VARVVIVGAGQGGFQTAASLRAEGFDGSITIIGDEPHLPYQRPPLSKGMLLGKQQERHAILRPADFYAAHKIDLITGERVTSLDLGSRRVELASRARVEYDWLVLATGARNRMLACEGALYVRTLDESVELRQRLLDASRVLVIGGGFIGLEVAAAARSLDKEVIVIEAAPRLMARVVAPTVSEYFRAQHQTRGVNVRLNEQREQVPEDALIVIGIGVMPNDELARDAGLPVGNGIQVNEYLQTPDERVFAIGDCADYPSIHAGRRVRLESVQNAVDQATHVGKTITGKPSPYTAAPWFWSDQFDIHLQMAGLSLGFDQTVVRGDPESHKFSTFYYRGGSLIAIDSINRPAEHLTARKLIAARAHITPDQAADESFELKSVL